MKKYINGKGYANNKIKILYKYLKERFDNFKLFGENMSLRMDIEQLQKNHEREIKLLEAEIEKLKKTHEIQLKRNEILIADNVGMYNLVKKYQKKLRIDDKVERRVFK